MNKPLSESKKSQLMQQMAEELRRKHDMELYKECLDFGQRLYELAKSQPIL